MLTRKQKWRRTKVNSISDLLKTKIDGDLNSENIPSIFENSFLNIFSCDCNRKPVRSNVKVEFSQIVKVILIPILKDYKDAKLDTEIWYSKDDYFLFKKEYMEDIKKAKYNSI